jgi:hypothetical protein
MDITVMTVFMWVSLGENIKWKFVLEHSIVCVDVCVCVCIYYLYAAVELFGGQQYMT